MSQRRGRTYRQPVFETAFVSSRVSSTEDLDDVDRISNHPLLQQNRLRKSRSAMGGSVDRGVSAFLEKSSPGPVTSRMSRSTTLNLASVTAPGATVSAGASPIDTWSFPFRPRSALTRIMRLSKPTSCDNILKQTDGSVPRTMVRSSRSVNNILQESRPSDSMVGGSQCQYSSSNSINCSRTVGNVRLASESRQYSLSSGRQDNQPLPSSTQFMTRSCNASLYSSPIADHARVQGTEGSPNVYSSSVSIKSRVQSSEGSPNMFNSPLSTKSRVQCSEGSPSIYSSPLSYHSRLQNSDRSINIYSSPSANHPKGLQGRIEDSPTTYSRLNNAKVLREAESSASLQSSPFLGNPKVLQSQNSNETSSPLFLSKVSKNSQEKEKSATSFMSPVSNHSRFQSAKNSPTYSNSYSLRSRGVESPLARCARGVDPCSPYSTKENRDNGDRPSHISPDKISYKTTPVDSFQEKGLLRERKKFQINPDNCSPEGSPERSPGPKFSTLGPSDHSSTTVRVNFYGSSSRRTSPGSREASPGSRGASPGSRGTSPGSRGASPGFRGASPGSHGASPGSRGASPGSRGASPARPRGMTLTLRTPPSTAPIQKKVLVTRVQIESRLVCDFNIHTFTIKLDIYFPKAKKKYFF